MLHMTNWADFSHIFANTTYDAFYQKRRVQRYNIEISKLALNFRQPEKINKIILHGSYTRQYNQINIADLNQWHVIEKGFADIGYHYFINKYGHIIVLRPLAYNGAHCLGHNENSIGICVAGGMAVNKKDWEDNYTEESRQSLAWLVDTLAKMFPIQRCRGHRTFDTNRLCPGTTFGCEFD